MSRRRSLLLLTVAALVGATFAPMTGWTEGDWPRAVVFAGRFVRSRSNSAAGARLMETVHDHKTAATTVHVTRTLVFNTVASLQIMHPEVQLTPPGGTNSHRIGARRPARPSRLLVLPQRYYAVLAAQFSMPRVAARRTSRHCVSPASD